MSATTRAIPIEFARKRTAAFSRGWRFGFLMMVGASSAFAGAWTQPAGSGAAYLSTTATSNDRYFNDDGNGTRLWPMSRGGYPKWFDAFS
jgi:hypothetical protein